MTGILPLTITTLIGSSLCAILMVAGAMFSGLKGVFEDEDVIALEESVERIIENRRKAKDEKEAGDEAE
jgi:hypothetical protein